MMMMTKEVDFFADDDRIRTEKKTSKITTRLRSTYFYYRILHASDYRYRSMVDENGYSNDDTYTDNARLVVQQFPIPTQMDFFSFTYSSVQTLTIGDKIVTLVGSIGRRWKQ